jgi:ribosomal protein L7Ae-like RNA K-turn-binding protein
LRVNNIIEKFFSLLGLCQKAGKLVSGSMLCENTIRSGKAQLIIISHEASEATMERFLGLSQRYKVELLVVGTQEQLGRSIGKHNRTVLAILDSGFKDMLLKLRNEIQHGGGR